MKWIAESSWLLLTLILNEVCAQTDNPTAAERRIAAVEELRDSFFQAEAREEDIKLINDEPLYDPYIKLRDEDDEPTVEWLTSYGGDPYGFEVVFFAVLPLILAKIIRITKNIFRPNLHLREGMSDFPLVPLIYLQQTKLEQSVKRERRNGIDWLGKKFLIRASDNFVDMKRAGTTAPLAKRMVSKNPWALLRFMAKFHHKTKGTHRPHRSESDMKIRRRSSSLKEHEKRRASLQERQKRRQIREEAKRKREERLEQKRRENAAAEQKRKEEENEINATGEPAVPQPQPEEKVDKFPEGPSFKEELKVFRKKRELGSRKLHKVTPLDAEGTVDRQGKMSFEDDSKGKQSSKEPQRKKHHKRSGSGSKQQQSKVPSKNASLQPLGTQKVKTKPKGKARHSLTHVNAPPEKEPETEIPYHIRQMKEFMPKDKDEKK